MSSLNVAFIKANWHSDIVSQALVGFQRELDRLQASCIVDVCAARVQKAARAALQIHRLSLPKN